MMAMMQTELEAAELPLPADYNGRLVAWLQLRTGSDSNSLPGLMALLPEQQGVHNWSSLGSFAAAP